MADIYLQGPSQLYHNFLSNAPIKLAQANTWVQTKAKTFSTEKPSLWKAGICAIAVLGTLGVYLAGRENPIGKIESPVLQGESPVPPGINPLPEPEITSTFKFPTPPPKYDPALADQPYTLSSIRLTKDTSFTGQWLHGQPLNGTLTSKIGNFTGQWLHGQPRSGTMLYTNGMQVTAEWEQDKVKGEIHYNGTRYEGSLAYDTATRIFKAHGPGVMHKLGSSYSGTYEENLLLGDAEISMADGSYLRAKYNQQGLAEGALYVSKKDECVLKYDGLWQNNEPSQGRLTEGHWVYEGSFKNKKRHGFGIQFYPDKSSYIGSFANDRREGQGIKFEPDSETFFSGLWNDNRPNWSDWKVMNWIKNTWYFWVPPHRY